MFKSYFFIEAEMGADPFRLRGDEARERFAEVLPDAVGYTQTRSLSEQIGETEDEAPVFAGVAELFFSRSEVALASIDHAAGLAPLLADGARVGPIVTGMARTVMRLPAHHDGGMIKAVFPFRRRRDLSVEAFQRYWWLQHGPIAARTEHATLYLQCHPLIETYAQGRPPYDGITELHWAGVAAARDAMASRQMREDQANDAANFVDRESVALFLAAEEVVLPA